MTQEHDIETLREVIRIGNTELRMTADAPLVRQSNPAYDPFYVYDAETLPAGVQSTIDIKVTVEPCTPSDTALLFDTGSPYRVQSEENGYRLSFCREGRRAAHTVLRSDDETRAVKIHVAQDIGAHEPTDVRTADPLAYPLDQLLMVYHLAARVGAVVHAAGAVLDGGAFVFPGFSGAGKSTLSRSFQAAGLQDALLSDDRVILREGPSGGAATGSEGAEGPAMMAWGTPWPGEAMVASNAGAPLTAVVFLTKAALNEVVPLGPAEAMKRLLPTVSCPWYDRERAGQVLETCTRVVENNPCYELRFTPGPEVVDLLAAYRWSAARD